MSMLPILFEVEDYGSIDKSLFVGLWYVCNPISQGEYCACYILNIDSFLLCALLFLMRVCKSINMLTKSFK